MLGQMGWDWASPVKTILPLSCLLCLERVIQTIYRDIFKVPIEIKFIKGVLKVRIDWVKSHFMGKYLAPNQEAQTSLHSTGTPLPKALIPY